MKIPRRHFIDAIKQAFRTHKVVALLGPRQCGKTTLARQYAEKMDPSPSKHFFDLEDPADLIAFDNPKTALGSLTGLVIIDEIQRVPDLFPVIRVLVDQPDIDRRFLILGSASRELIRQTSETLAGRIAYIELTPFSLFEVGEAQKLWVRGGFPHSFLAETERDSAYWRQQYIKTFLEVDIPSFGLRIPPLTLRRFWMMLSHYHGQAFRASEIGRSLGLSDTTARNYLDILAGTFMVRQLQPWIENISKRQVKLPKIYFRDSGIYHALQDIRDFRSLLRHPHLGASWEGFALEEVIRYYQADSENCYFWGVHGQSELDLLLFHEGKRLGFEFKYGDKPQLTTSMRSAKEHLKLDSLCVVYPGDKTFSLGPNIQAIGLSQLVAQSND